MGSSLVLHQIAHFFPQSKATSTMSRRSDDVVMSSTSVSYRSFYARCFHKLEDIIDDINWIHVAFKVCAYLYISLVVYSAWMLWPAEGHWTTIHNIELVESHS
jgi:hypothetical protein